MDHPVDRWLRQIGSRVERHRLNQNRSQTDVADHAGVTRQTVERLESGRSVRLDSLIRILTALELSDGLESLVSDVADSPIQLLDRSSNPRRRASKRVEPAATSPWEWGTDE